MSLEFLAAMFHAQDMRDLPACARLTGMCNAALIANIDDAGHRHVHFCGMGATHASPDMRSPAHRCVCGETWTEAMV